MEMEEIREEKRPADVEGLLNGIALHSNSLAFCILHPMSTSINVVPVACLKIVLNRLELIFR